MARTSKKVFEVVKATTRDIDGIKVAGKELKFNQAGTLMTDDPGIAREIEQRHGWTAGEESSSVVVCELEAYNEFRDRRPGSKNQHYFSVPALPWKKDQ